uniref:KIB1-4 beta-propeller domain-containing protein n=1 Tax=Davidia involucrata TaxID=16924 RepID=A0A5B7B3J0_DAVIN
MALQKKLRMTSDPDLDWSGLPKNILDLILDKLVSLGDFVRFTAVCVPWRSVALEDRNNRNRRRFCEHQLPMLMIPSDHDYIRGFYSVTHEEELQFEIPVPYNKRFIGSSFGWLIFVHTDFAVTLFNPFSRGNNAIHLPPIVRPEKMNEDGNFDFEKLDEIVFNHEYYFVKAILSAEPASCSDDEYVVVVIYSELRRLAFMEPGRERGWSYLDGPEYMGFDDVIYRNGLFYGLTDSGAVLCIEMDQSTFRVAYVTPTLETESPCDMRYIVESCRGDLLQVLRFSECCEFSDTLFTSEFKVFKLHKSFPLSYWIELKSLGDDVLFLGDNSSLSVLASEFPGCRRGSIYFSFGFMPDLLIMEQPYKSSGPCDMALLTLENRCFKPLNIRLDSILHDAMLNRPPIWIVPTFQEAGSRDQDGLSF